MLGVMINCMVSKLPWNEWEWMLESKIITDTGLRSTIFTNTTPYPVYILVGKVGRWAKGWHNGMS